MSEGAAGWERSWSAEVLQRPPLIAPARQFTYPLEVAGEEDAMGRGALQLLVKPREGGSFLATCALGFVDERMPTAVLACPDADEMCAVAGGYAYVVDTVRPERVTQIPLKPVVEVRALVDRGLLLFTGFHSIVAWGRSGLAWETQRLSWEGVRLGDVEGDVMLGTGWNLMTDKDVPFALDLRTGAHEGGGFTQSAKARRS